MVAVSTFDRPSLPYLLELLQEGDFQERWDAVKQLSEFGEPAIAHALDLLRSQPEDEELCWFVARLLGNSRSPEAIATLADLLANHPDEDVRVAAAATLARLGPQAIAPLSQLLDRPQERFLAVRALAEIRHPDVVDALLPYANDADISLRATVLTAFSNFRDRRVLAPLVRGLEDPAAAVRCQATIGLGVRQDLAEELELVKLLRRRLFDPDLNVCQQAAIALSRLGSDKAVEVLSIALRSPHTPASLRSDIAWALGWLETPASVAALGEALFASTDEDLCCEILTVFSHGNSCKLSSQIHDVLTQWLNSEHPARKQPYIRRAIAFALRRIGSPAIAQFQSDPDETVRWHAAAKCS
ncbi:hypothetical protein AY599_08195 [Leptolyngbya valderiana BDU 20041]|nr:HEAT repeat domain-containing protein [Geitlerinema sp. CS-897]OAB63024.1 hypothetical protein AY599_08195 [Leptolyngbya valderiana BDU 20041]PPT05547.1 HEAT repeat [Geitlerinema sp. FC II]